MNYSMEVIMGNLKTRYCIMQEFTKTAYDVMSVFILIIAFQYGLEDDFM